MVEGTFLPIKQASHPFPFISYSEYNVIDDAACNLALFQHVCEIKLFPHLSGGHIYIRYSFLIHEGNGHNIHVSF
jgi:hypothetical protein